MLFLILAWRTWLLRVRDIFLSSSTRSTATNPNFVFSFFRWREEGATSVFRVPANRLASTFSLPVSGDLREVTEYKHLFLTVILWWLATVNSNQRIVVIIFLSSQWDITWHYVEVLREFRKRFRRKRLALFKSAQWHFQQDNAPVHDSILVTDYLIKMGIKTVPQPL